MSPPLSPVSPFAALGPSAALFERAAPRGPDQAGDRLRALAARGVPGQARGDARALERIDARVADMSRALARLMRGAALGVGVLPPGRGLSALRLDYSAEARVGEAATARESLSLRALRSGGTEWLTIEQSRSVAAGEQSLSWEFSLALRDAGLGPVVEAGSDVIRGSDVADVISSAEVEAISLGAFGARGLPGAILAGEGDDAVTLDGRLANLAYLGVDLGGGDDVLTGAARAIDLVQAGAGNDAISLSTTYDVAVEAGEGADAVALSAGGAARVDGGAGGDAISVLADRAEISGGLGADAIAVVAAQAQVDGGEGADAISVLAGLAQVSGGQGDDAVTVVADRASVAGGAGNDVLSVTADRIEAVSGGDGDDVITVAGGEAARVSGGAGNDLLLIAAERATLDFAAGDGADRLQVAAGSVVVIRAEGDFAVARQEDGTLRLTLASGDTLAIEGAGEVVFAPPQGPARRIHATTVDLRV